MYTIFPRHCKIFPQNCLVLKILYILQHCWTACDISVVTYKNNGFINLQRIFWVTNEILINFIKSNVFVRAFYLIKIYSILKCEYET